MSVPRFNADASIYKPTINYASALITDIAAHQPLPLAAQPVRLESPPYTMLGASHNTSRSEKHDFFRLVPTAAKSCNDLAYIPCWNYAVGAWHDCEHHCPPADNPCLLGCTELFEQILENVCDPAGCPPGTICQNDVSVPKAQFCCPQGEVPCQGE
jgi:hypothetical protein